MKSKKGKAFRKIYREQTINSWQKKIDMLGIEHTYNAEKFLNIRLLTSIVLFIIVFVASEIGYILAPLVTLAYYILIPKLVIDVKLNKRRDILEKEAMYFFEILTLSLESGRTLQNALKLTSDNIDGELSKEVKYALEEVKYGRSLDESLENLKKRIPSDTINNILLNIRESNIFGNNIVETLYNQIDYIRDKRTMKTKEIINKIPLKVSVVSVVFFIPLILLLILGPAIIDYLVG